MLEFVPLKSYLCWISLSAWLTAFLTSAMSTFETTSNVFCCAMVDTLPHNRETLIGRSLGNPAAFAPKPQRRIRAWRARNSPPACSSLHDYRRPVLVRHRLVESR